MKRTSKQSFCFHGVKLEREKMCSFHGISGFKEVGAKTET